MLSKAGREVLIKAIAQSIPTYAMSVFKLPANFCDEVRSLISSFWWGSSKSKRKIPWVAWEKLCRPKNEGGLGFRDLIMFNQALLGKQAWRLVINDGSLMVRVLKGKYCPETPFLKSNLGGNPSYTWRGIWGAKEVITLGARKRIGNGLSTNVWTDAWIPGTQSKRVLSPRRDADETMCVADLFTGEGGRWDNDKLTSLFLPFEQRRITQIRLTKTQEEDDWCWDHERDGDYSVRSGYKLFANREDKGCQQSNTEAGRWLWNRIWKSKVLPRIKVFTWQLCNEAISTKFNLCRRIKGLDDSCPNCHFATETCTHVFRDCGWVEEVWTELGLEVCKELQNCRARDWMECVMRGMTEEECEVFVTGCWAIWEARNKTVFEGTNLNPRLVISRVLSLLAEMRDIEHSDTPKNTNMQERQAQGWRKPTPGTFKINVDAGVKEGWGLGIGVVCRGATGEIEWSVVYREDACRDPSLVEAEAILLGAKEAREAGYKEIILESDCLPVIQDLKLGKQGRSDIFLVYEEILLVCKSFSSCTFNYVNRKFNRVTYELAHMSLLESGRSFFSNAPVNILDVANLDRIEIN